ncbi:MAG: ATP-binding cassette domain-containing protein [Bacillota bacterium]|nr:ATP-binding cassette domain-containing protein [Bacillota bacterium]
MSEIIKIENLNKTFQSKQSTVVALDDINITIEAGEIFGIIGLSGAGKSTLVRCINYLERPTAGRVMFDGHDLGALSSKELLQVRRSMSMIFQQFNLLMQKTALQNICFPMNISGVNKDEAKKRALELLDIVGLADKANAYPAQLSGGQKQRVAIARALATNPKVLLCDEATSALDPTTTRSILDLLKDINKTLGITIVIITHEMSVIEEVCQRVAIIDSSHVVEIGKVADVFLEPKSDMAKQLIFPGAKKVEPFVGGRTLRLVFDGDTFIEPVIGNMVLECGAPVNILFADIEKVEGKTFGQMLIELPENETMVKRIYSYLRVKKIHFEEENV